MKPKKEEKLVLRPFQQEDVRTMRKHDYRVIVANAPGTGKTIECLSAIGLDRQKLCPVVVVCPASVVWHWHRESRKWCRWARIHVIEDRMTPIPRERAHIYVLSWSLLMDRATELAGVRPQLLIADEAHFAKNIEAQRSQALYALSRGIPHLMLLTGTPIINNIREFDVLKEMYGTMEVPVIRRLLTDVATEIPPKTRMPLPVYLRPRIAQEYRKAVEQFSTWLREALRERMEEGEAEAAARRALAAEALVKIGYLRRIVGKGKAHAAADWAARAVRMGEQVVIFAEHTAVIRKLHRLLRQQRIRHVILAGDTVKRERQEMIDAFQRGDIPVFVGTKAATTGITLTAARHMCFIEYYWTSSELDQAEDRIRRIGQRYETKIWFLHAMNTIDDRIAQIIDRKRALISRHIRTEEVDESPEDSVMEMIAEWSKQARAPLVNGDAMLGLVKALPPLPQSKFLHMAIFKGPRWTETRVKGWAKMNGYRLQTIKFDGKGFRCVSNRMTLFVAGTFSTFRISNEITLIVGKRRKKVPQKALRRMHKHGRNAPAKRGVAPKRKAKRRR
jgi:SNF2 family DNA or RNA helicase